MEFRFDNGPHLKDNDNTSKIMRRLLIALTPIILFSIYKNGILPYTKGYIDFLSALKPLFMILMGILTSILTEFIFYSFVLKDKKEVLKKVKTSYAIFPGLFLVLTLPINTPFWIIIFGAFIATFVGKLLFGGFGYNIFNPALVGALFVTASYGTKLSYLNPLELDTVAGATPLGALSGVNHIGTFTNIIKPYGTLWDFFFGFIPGSFGETCKILIILAFLYLMITKVIKWVIPVSYVVVVFLMTSIIGVMNDMELWYSMFHILSGGLLFGAVFMATDPVSSPTTKIGQLLYGIGLGLLTVIFRFLTPAPEGVLTSILTMNMLVFITDKIGAKAKFKASIRYVSISVLVVLCMIISFYIGTSIKKDVTTDERFKIVDVKKSGNKTIYEVEQKGVGGMIKASISIQNDKITTVDIISHNETSLYWGDIEKANYIDKLIAGQNNLKGVDTISGVTGSSSALKVMLENVLKDYEVRK